NYFLTNRIDRAGKACLNRVGAIPVGARYAVRLRLGVWMFSRGTASMRNAASSEATHVRGTTSHLKIAVLRPRLCLGAALQARNLRCTARLCLACRRRPPLRLTPRIILI